MSAAPKQRLNAVHEVVKRDGRIEPFSDNRIINAVSKAIIATRGLEFLKQEGRQFPERVLKSVTESLASREVLEEPPLVEEIQNLVEQALMQLGLYDVAKAYVLYRKERERVRDEKMRLLDSDSVDEVAKRLSLNAVRLLASRYLLRDEKGRIIESIMDMFKRVASLIVIPDILYDTRLFDKEGKQEKRPRNEIDASQAAARIQSAQTKFKDWNKYHIKMMHELYEELNEKGEMNLSWTESINLLAEGQFDSYYQSYLEFYNLMVNKEFMPNSPTLFNAGAILGQLSACFVIPIEDNIESIMKSASDCAVIFKSGGGVGINYSNLRPEGDVVASTGGIASGPVTFMRIIDTVTDVVKQGGKRRGANMGMLDISHPDIETFIRSKYETKYYENFNISVMVQREFWKHFKEKSPWPLINPRNHEVVRTTNPTRLFKEIAAMAWNTADPGVAFQDNVNHGNPLKEHWGDIRCMNPCVTGDCRIPTSDGLVRISELDLLCKSSCADRMVVTDNRALQEKVLIIPYRRASDAYEAPGVSSRKILRIVASGKKPVFSVQTEHGYFVKATEDHRILTTKGWVPIGDLKIGDKLMIQSGEGGFGGAGSSELGRILGWFVGDGSWSYGKVTLFFYGSDKELADLIANDVSKELGTKETKTSGPYPYSDARMINSRRLFKLFKSLHIEKRIEVPEVVFKGTRETQQGFLQSLFTADGTVNIANGGCCIRLASISKNLLKGVQLLLLNFGIVSRIYADRKPNQSRLLPDGRQGLKFYQTQPYHDLSIDGEDRDNFVTKIGFLDLSKQSKAMQWIGEKKRNSNAEKYISKVKDITYSGMEDVYDITEPVTNSFIANGICVHNCGEEPMYPYESCNLGSINLHAFVKRSEGGQENEKECFFDWNALADCVENCTRFLDNVIDVTSYPIQEIREVSKKTRRVGIGVMGLADALYALRIPYTSEEGFAFMSRVAEFLVYHSTKQSTKLAKTRGSFPLFDNSSFSRGELPFDAFKDRNSWTLPWDSLANDVVNNGIRNSHTVTIAPTGSISMIVDVSSGLEPQFALVFEKHVSVGSFYYNDAELERMLRERGMLNESELKRISDNGGSIQGLEGFDDALQRVFLVAYDIPWWDHVRAQYEMQKWISASVSKTINMPSWVSNEDVENAYLFAYRLGLKGMTIYRDGSKDKQVLRVPSQRVGKYVSSVQNNTLKIMKELGIETPSEQIEVQNFVVQEPESRAAVPLGMQPPECPICGSENIVSQEGCRKCLECGWSTCTVA